MDKPKWGPWSHNHDTGDPIEYKAKLRSLATLCYVHIGPSAAALVLLLRKCEFCQDYLEPAREAFDQQPTLITRKIISTFNTVNHWLPMHDDRRLKQKEPA